MVSAVGATQVPLASLLTSSSLTLSVFSSAKAKPTQPSDVSDPAMPSMIALSLARGRVVGARRDRVDLAARARSAVIASST